MKTFLFGLNLWEADPNTYDRYNQLRLVMKRYKIAVHELSMAFIAACKVAHTTMINFEEFADAFNSHDA